MRMTYAEQSRKWRLANPEKFKATQERYRKKNWKKILAKRLKWQKEQYKSNPNFRKMRSESTKKYQKENRDKVNEKNRLWRLRNKEKCANYAKIYYQNGGKDKIKVRTDFDRQHTPKGRARNVLYNAIRTGKIVRPTQCSKCLKFCKPHGHHPNHLKPLEVVWLCPSCHWYEDNT